MSAPVEGKPSIKQRRLAPENEHGRGLATPYPRRRPAGGGATHPAGPPRGRRRHLLDSARRRLRVGMRRIDEGYRPARVFEETGLRVDVGPLVYVREFAEPAAGRFHMELFYRIDAWRGEPTLANLKGLGGDEFDIREVGWIARDELPGLPSFYPAELADDVWSRLDAPTPSIRHLGLQRQTLTAPDRWWGSRGSPSAPRSWETPGSTPWAGSAAGTSAGRCPVSRPSDTARPGSR